ncbi:flavin-containing monooxygenase [Robertmurraya korlensis]|uniref:flavin-containing monooxygenase n=1 Tax=Robertmurraya korlensis TaxID=519977 RepID=UPI000825509B|nr:NAD(P)/FAD-dependent oxidoreductase [Robertmurraya korlensis]
MYDVLVVGAGQAGLAMGYYLKKSKRSFLILDQSSVIGESWRKRYDSLTLFTPRIYSSLPGLILEGNQESYPTKNEISEYLSLYAKTFSLPVQLNTYIMKLEEKDYSYVLTTNKGEFRARNVVVATGPFQKPIIPEFYKNLLKGIMQLHSSKYKNPSQLKEGITLVVGGGNSGAQIAAEIAEDRNVYLSVGHPLRFLPQDIGTKSIFWWFDKLGVLKVNVNSKIGKYLKNMPDPIFGFELKEKIKQGKVTIKPRVMSAQGSQVAFDDGSLLKVNNIIWSTGFKADYSWIDIPSIFDNNGLPIHERGVTSKKGLFFLGMPWQYRKGSAILQGVGMDARYISNKL